MVRAGDWAVRRGEVHLTTHAFFRALLFLARDRNPGNAADATSRTSVKKKQKNKKKKKNMSRGGGNPFTS